MKKPKKKREKKTKELKTAGVLASSIHKTYEGTVGEMGDNTNGGNRAGVHANPGYNISASILEEKQ